MVASKAGLLALAAAGTTRGPGELDPQRFDAEGLHLAEDLRLVAGFEQLEPASKYVVWLCEAPAAAGSASSARRPDDREERGIVREGNLGMVD